MSDLTSNLTMQDQYRRYNVLKNYFTAGFSYEELCNFLFRFHRIKITIRHLNLLLRQCNLQRRGNHSNINTVIKFSQDELKGSSSCFGYLYMLQKLRSSGLTDDEETVRLILKSLEVQFQPFSLYRFAANLYIETLKICFILLKILYTVGQTDSSFPKL